MHLSQIIAFKSKTLVNKLDALLHWCVHFYPRTSFFLFSSTALKGTIWRNTFGYIIRTIWSLLS